MDQTKIWDHFQIEDAIGDAFAGARPRYEFLSGRIEPGLSVLNIGVGRGGLERILLENGVRVSCLDPSEKSIENLRKLFGLGDCAQVGCSSAIPFTDGQFDVVIMSEVLEHLTDEILNATLIQVVRVLKPGGQFIGTVPADEKLLFNQVMCPNCGNAFHRWGHVQTFSASRLAQLLTSCFDGVKVSRHYFGDVQSLNWKGRIAYCVKKVLIGLGLEGSGETYFFSACKK